MHHTEIAEIQAQIRALEGRSMSLEINYNHQSELLNEIKSELKELIKQVNKSQGAAMAKSIIFNTVCTGVTVLIMLEFHKPILSAIGLK